jgi:asparagine synthetase B (glutamine-hydrolysing)
MATYEQIKYKYRGMVAPEKIISSLKSGDYGFVHTQKLGYYFSYETSSFQFHVVDRFASFPLFYCIKDGKPYVTENVEDLLPKLDKIEFDPVGFYTAGGFFKGERNELTPFVGIKRIMPGHYLEYKNGQIKLVQYWSFHCLKDKPFKGTIDEAAEKLGFLIRQAIKRCYDFDKNCAVHLSGGLDSGVIASLYAGFSNSDVQAYLYKHKDDPMAIDTESGFVKKYLSHYPNIKLKSFDFNLQFSNSEYSTGNWHTIRTNSHEGMEITHASKNGHKFILTGLGGDELSSYRMSSIKKQLIDNDLQALKHRRYRKQLSTRVKKIIKILIGREGNPIHALKLFSSQDFFSNRHFWYTNEFYRKNKYLMDKPPMTPEFYPATLGYRLDVLSRSWFTIRSDRWNYLGSKNGIDFIHPLLDADLVSFAACIPTEMLIKIDKRGLFKKAIEKLIPLDLTEGVKRRFHKTKMNTELLEKKLNCMLVETDGLKHSYASSVYNINILYRQVKSSLRKLHLIEKYKKYDETTAIFNHLAAYDIILSNIKYLGQHFETNYQD